MKFGWDDRPHISGLMVLMIRSFIVLLTWSWSIFTSTIVFIMDCRKKIFFSLYRSLSVAMLKGRRVLCSTLKKLPHILFPPSSKKKMNKRKAEIQIIWSNYYIFKLFVKTRTLALYWNFMLFIKRSVSHLVVDKDCN